MTKKKTTQPQQVRLDGMMTIGKLNNGLRIADFQSFDYTEMEPFLGRCKMQIMRSGDIYISELPRRQRNRPLFRLENSTMTLGQNGMFYFTFRLPEAELDVLPQTLVVEAIAAAAQLKAMSLETT